MSEMSYVQVIGHYDQHTNSINQLMSSILSGMNDPLIFNDQVKLETLMSTLKKNYPFIDILYRLDDKGIQSSNNFGMKSSANIPTEKDVTKDRIGKDRSHRPYFIQAQQNENSQAIVTSPYLSSASRSLCITAAIKVKLDDEVLGYLVVDIDLARTIEFMMGDTLRSRFSGLFKTVFSLISLGLFSVVLLLFYLSFKEILTIFDFNNNQDKYSKPFGIIIYLTLALAIFDLAKTTLEEEVLMHKDIFRHSSTRRTITRFMSAILIAVSIESLILMFKSVLSDDGMLLGAVAMMLSAALLLLALGVYVYLSAKAEAKMLESRQFINKG